MNTDKKILAAVLALLLVLSSCAGEPPTVEAPPPPEPEPEIMLPPKPEPIVKTGTATIAATGDILMHQPIIKTGLDRETGEYDFAGIFPYIHEYVSSADLAVANLETTLAGTDNGYPYQGYPRFNCPDGIVGSLGTAGFDLLLTGNNHSYDTGEKGFFRTLRVIDEEGLLRLGTRLTREEKAYTLQELNGIKLGMISYTYETGHEDPTRKSLNCLPLSEKASALVNTFDVAQLEEFYADLEHQLGAMRAEGAEATILFIHWGYEYHTEENADQRAMAQAICDMGVDVIIGGHPHVIQPVELLTSQKAPEHKTVCLYSMGNAVSNQRLERMPSYDGYTEDGVIFQVTFARYSDGTVLLEWADALPTWVNLTMGEDSGKTAYEIIPLDTGVEDWQTAFTLTDRELTRAEGSYARTMGLLGEGLAQVQQFLKEQPTPDQGAGGEEKV